MAKASSSPDEHVNHEQLGKAVEQALVADYVIMLSSTRRQITGSFVRGIFGGLGGVVGATLGVAMLVALLQLFGGIPMIGRYFENAGHTIQTHQPVK